MIILLISSIILVFLGYSIGRIGHIKWGHLNFIHHWTYGLAIAIIGLFISSQNWKIILATIGAGLFISDFDDFLHFRIWSRDKEGKKCFWGFD